jgi:hypothetical protein
LRWQRRSTRRISLRELAPLVAKHKADLAALDAQKAAAMARAQQPYVAALDSAEKTATTAGTLEVVAAITKEREALKSGLMAPAWPEGLPKTLQPARKACLDGIARVSVDTGPRQKAIDAEYLRALAALQPKAAGNPELTKQTATEKEKLLANAIGSAGGTRPTAASSRNTVVNGTFDIAEADGRPRGWTFYGPGAEGLMKVVREGSNSFLQMVIRAPRCQSKSINTSQFRRAPTRSPCARAFAERQLTIMPMIPTGVGMSSGDSLMQMEKNWADPWLSADVRQDGNL